MVIGWINQAFGMSAFPTEVAGRTAVLSHIGEIDNGDVGICLCAVHGGLEMGGGLLHGGISLPIDGGALSTEARRRLELPGDAIFPKTFVYDAVEDFSHGTGDAQGDGWAASTGFHDAGHMLYGPYTTDWCGFEGEATFFMQVDNVTADDLAVVNLEVFNSTKGELIGFRTVTRTEFDAPFQFQNFSVSFDAKDLADDVLEARVFWTDVSFVKVNTVSVSLYTQ